MPPTAEGQLLPDFADVDSSSSPQQRGWAQEGGAPIKKKTKKAKKSRRGWEEHYETPPVVAPQVDEDDVPPAEVQEEPVFYRPVEQPEVEAVPEVEPEPQILVDVNGFEDDEHGADTPSLAPSAPARAVPPARASPAPSPRSANVRPATHSLTPPQRPANLHSPPSQYAYPSAYRPPPPAQPARRPSMTSPRQRIVEPAAPPHMPQPHFYGLPDLGLFGSQPEQPGKPPGSDGYCCCFDSFAESGDAASARRARNALLVGSEGGLEVYRVLPSKFEVVGRLEGLRGAVVGAKILPASTSDDSHAHLRPLVAVIVHGIADEYTKTLGGHFEQSKAYYHTTVEIYSLQTQAYVCTLFTSQAVALEQPTVGHLSTIPGPQGDLRLAAHGKFVTITSGKSGEVYVFTSAASTAINEPHWRCIGKLWTSLQQPTDRPASRPLSLPDESQLNGDADRKPGVPLYSLSPRWLAIVPPSTSSQISIQGTVALHEDYWNPSGLSSHVAPPQPSITCDIAGVDAEGTWGRLTRQAAQGLVKYSQRGFEMGRQGWNELVNPTNPNGAQHGRSPSKEDMFPPTNAPREDPRREAKEPAVVSIVDLEALLEAEELKPKYPPAPMATFALEEGCNYLSFASSGLRLLTVSRSGEASTVWDLKQTCHGTYTLPGASIEDAEAVHTPCVKLVKRVPRSSPAVVIDSAWSREDDLLAMLTNHGTVHLHEIPANPPSRKRKRRPATATAPGLDKGHATVGITHSTSPPSAGLNGGGGLFGTLRSGLQSVTSQVSTMRSQQPAFGLPTFAGFREATAQAGHAGSRALARGISQGYSAARTGAVEYLHADDNKIRNKALQQGQTTVGSCLRWIQRPSGTLLAIAAGGIVHVHPVSRVQRQRADSAGSMSGLKHDKAGRKTFELPHIKTSEDTLTLTSGGKSAECRMAGPHGFWSLRALSPQAIPEDRRVKKGVEVQVTEVETNPPYCPFHIDARVNIFAFDYDGNGGTGSQIRLYPPSPSSTRTDTATFLSQGHGDMNEEAWVFGGGLPPSIKMNTHEDLPTYLGGGGEQQEYGDEGVTDSDMEAVAEQVESRLTIRGKGGGQEEISVVSRSTRGRDLGGATREKWEDEDGFGVGEM